MSLIDSLLTSMGLREEDQGAQTFAYGEMPEPDAPFVPYQGEAQQPQQLPPQQPQPVEQIPEGIDPNKWSQADDELKQKGPLASAAFNELAKNSEAEDSWYDNFSRGATEFFGDKQNMIAMALAFNSLRYEPDQGLAAVLGKQLETESANKLSNKTINALMRSGDPKKKIIADMMMGGLTYKEALAAMKESDFDKKWRLAGGDAKKYKDMFGTGQTINVGAAEKAEDVERAKLFAKSMSSLSEKGSKASGTIRDIQVLQALGQSENLNSLPTWVTARIPQGFNSSKDAYEAVMIRVALSQKEAGTGAMSDKDFDRFIAAAGSIAASPEAKLLAHQLLMENQQIIADKTKVANQYMAGQIEKAEAVSKISEIDSRNISSELLAKIESMSGIDAPPQGTTELHRRAQRVWHVLSPDEKEAVRKELSGAQQ